MVSNAVMNIGVHISFELVFWGFFGYPCVEWPDECESWTVKKGECRKIDAFEPWCWRRLLRVPWTARRSNQSILKEISPGCSLEGLMLKLKLQYFGHLMWRADSLEKTLMLGGIGGRRRRGWLRMRWLDGITNSMDTGLSKLQELVIDRKPGVLWFMGSQRVGHDWATELNWTELMVVLFLVSWEIFILFSAEAASVYIPTNSAQRFHFLHVLPTVLLFLFFLMIAILIGVWWYLMVLNCVYLMSRDVEHLFMFC